MLEKLIKQLKSPEIEEFITALDPQLVRVKTLPFNKHISQIQKEIEKRLGSSPVMSVQPALGSRQPPPIDISAAPTPPLLSEDTQSPQSSSQPSTTNSTVDGPIGERKEKESPGLRVEGDDDTIIAATSATPKATEAN